MYPLGSLLVSSPRPSGCSNAPVGRRGPHRSAMPLQPSGNRHRRSPDESASAGRIYRQSCGAATQGASSPALVLEAVAEARDTECQCTGRFLHRRLTSRRARRRPPVGARAVGERVVYSTDPDRSFYPDVTGFLFDDFRVVALTVVLVAGTRRNPKSSHMSSRAPDREAA